MARYGIRREPDGAWWCGHSVFADDLWRAAAFDTFELADATCAMLNPKPAALSVALIPERSNPMQAAALREAERFMSYFAGETNAFVGPGTPETCLAEIRAALGSTPIE
jgi:hypothetical protein